MTGLIQNNRLGVLLSGVATIGIIVIMTVFLYSNPYFKVELSTQAIVIIGFILPTVFSFVSGVWKKKILMIIFFSLSLPIGLYLGLAAIPSVWNVIVPMLILQFVAAAMIHKPNTNSKKRLSNKSPK